jgi:deoxyribodipyrimidine photo-lyase
MRELVDGDPAANDGGWQWTAGVGTDAAPYFPDLQSGARRRSGAIRRTYVRRWVPELARVPAPTFTSRGRWTRSSSRAAGCIIGRDYPAPIVEHGAVRERTLAAYRQAPGTEAT